MAGLIAPRVSAPVYFGGVATATALGLVLAMMLRPSFAHTVLQLARLEPIPQAAQDSFYEVRVAPLFKVHCTSCHGPQRDKGGLRLDTFAGTMRGGKHGGIIVAADPKDSELFTRITLPAADEKAMPPSGKAALSADDVKVVELWIAAGASGSLPVGAIKGAPRLVTPVVMPEINIAAVQKERAPLAAQVAQLQSHFPGIIEYDSRSSANLVVNASLRRDAFGDADLRALAPLQQRIVEVNLSNTAVTDASARLLAAMPLLRLLRLVDTKTTDTTIQSLASSKSLKVLVVGKVSPTVLAPMRQHGVRIYEAKDNE